MFLNLVADGAVKHGCWKLLISHAATAHHAFRLQSFEIHSRPIHDPNRETLHVPPVNKTIGISLPRHGLKSLHVIVWHHFTPPLLIRQVYLCPWAEIVRMSLIL